MALNAIATKRKILIEKFSCKRTKLKKLCLFEFGNDKLLISLVKSPKAKIQKSIINDPYQTGYKILWSSIEFVIVDNIGENNASSFCRWVSDSTYEVKNRALAKTINLTKLYDNETTTSETFVITGCLLEKFELKKEPSIIMSINNCSATQK